MPQFTRLAIPDLIEVIPDRHGDERGFFSETYNKAVWSAGGIAVDFIQDNHSLSRETGTLRGLHFQTPPMAQAKLVRVSRGRAFDVAVDIRSGSPSYRQWVGIELSADKGNQLFIPAGFAHGFLTLEPDTEFLYKVTAPYSRPHDRSVRFDDPDIAIDWPVPVNPDGLSQKDRDAGRLADTETGFFY